MKEKYWMDGTLQSHSMRVRLDGWNPSVTRYEGWIYPQQRLSDQKSEPPNHGTHQSKFSTWYHAYDRKVDHIKPNWKETHLCRFSNWRLTLLVIISMCIINKINYFYRIYCKFHSRRVYFNCVLQCSIYEVVIWTIIWVCWENKNISMLKG